MLDSLIYSLADSNSLRYLYIIFVRVGSVPEQTLMEYKEAWNDVLGA